VCRRKNWREKYHLAQEAVAACGAGIDGEVKSMATVNLDQVMTFAPQVLQLNQKNIWLSYDEEADVFMKISKSPAMPTIRNCWIMMSLYAMKMMRSLA
jgi:hypothetical protein